MSYISNYHDTLACYTTEFLFNSEEIKQSLRWMGMCPVSSVNH